MTRPQETFTDMLARLFPMPGIQLGINSPHSKCITFQVTEDCNLRCSYCYQGCKTHRKMSLETAKAAVDMLLAADERTNQYITSTEVAGVVLDFIGGEPLLEVELIDQILDYFVAQTFRLHHPWATRWKASMSTNGTLYFRPEVQRFLDKWAKHLSLSISIDGDKQLHDSCRVFPDGSGSYDLAIAAAKDYMTKGNALGSKMTIALRQRRLSVPRSNRSAGRGVSGDQSELRLRKGLDARPCGYTLHTAQTARRFRPALGRAAVSVNLQRKHRPSASGGR